MKKLILIKGGMFMGKTTKAKKLQKIYPNSAIVSIAQKIKEEVEDKKNLTSIEKEYLLLSEIFPHEKNFFKRRLFQIYSDRIKKEKNDEFYYCKYLLNNLPPNEVIIIDDVRRNLEIEFFKNNLNTEIEIIDLSLKYKNSLRAFNLLMSNLLSVYTALEIIVLIKHNSERENWDIEKVIDYLTGGRRYELQKR